MKPILFMVALAAMSVPTAAEPSYNPSFYNQLTSLGLDREAFVCALQWAGSANPDAVATVANALLEGIGVEANPVAAIAIVCDFAPNDELELQKILIRANLRLAGTTEFPLRCAATID